MLLAWDTYEAHMTEKVKVLLKDMKVESVFIPGGCTKYTGTSHLKDLLVNFMTNGCPKWSLPIHRSRQHEASFYTYRGHMDNGGVEQSRQGANC